MRYACISSPDDIEYLLFHRALVKEKNGMMRLFYNRTKQKHNLPVTFTSKTGILLNITQMSANIIGYNMFIPETNPYFNIIVLTEEFPYLDKEHPEVKKVVKTKMHATFKRVLKEYNESLE